MPSHDFKPGDRVKFVASWSEVRNSGWSPETADLLLSSEQEVSEDVGYGSPVPSGLVPIRDPRDPSMPWRVRACLLAKVTPTDPQPISYTPRPRRILL